MLARLLILGLLLAATALASESENAPSGSETDCVANSLGKLRDLPEGLPDCAKADPSCADACLAGDARSCLARAYTVEKQSSANSSTSSSTNTSSRAEAMSLYRRACLLGLANACTNYAATIWAGEHTVAELACAQHTFGKACEANEPFACGMAGRMAFDQATSPADFERGRQQLEVACEKIGGFPCRVLAKHLEAGDLGKFDPKRIRALLEQACKGGDPNACGRPATAAETFR